MAKIGFLGQKMRFQAPKKIHFLTLTMLGEKCIFFTLSYVIAYKYMYYALQSGNDPLKGDLTFAYLYLSNIGLKTELFA